MSMPGLLREIPKPRQIPDDPRRRWFTAPGLDLIVWFDESNQPLGFQLCYEKKHKEFALTWKAGKGYDHSAVDSGEQLPIRNRTPVLVADGTFDADYVSRLFEAASVEVPSPLRSLVSEALRVYPRNPNAPQDQA